MAVIQLKGLSPSDAEKAIVGVWFVLEERQIESPLVEAHLDGEGGVNVRFIFDRQCDADAVLRVLKGCVGNSPADKGPSEIH